MDKDTTTTTQSVLLNQPGVGRLVIRVFDPESDSLHAVKALRRQASLATSDTVMPGQASGAAASAALPQQPKCETFVAIRDLHLVGTMTIEPPGQLTTCEHYQRSTVAIVRDLAVEVSMRRHGIAQVMLAYAGRHAAAQGYAQLAFEVPCAKEELMSYCRFLGFTLVEVVKNAAGDDRAIFSCPTISGWPAFYAATRMALWMQDPSET